MKKQIAVLIGNTLDELATLPEESVQCVITSPPYWGLRDYGEGAEMVFGGEKDCRHEWGLEETKWPNAQGGPGYKQDTNPGSQFTDYKDRLTESQFCSLCGAWRGQFGLEPTPEMYVEHTLEFLRAIRRVLRKDGTVWWNIGDSYSGGHRRDEGFNERWHGKHYLTDKQGDTDRHRPARSLGTGLKPKNLVMIPFRVALAAQADGWWVRSIIIWNKTNPMPESVKDRPTSSHEYVLLLTKSKKYFYDADAIREPLGPASISRMKYPVLAEGGKCEAARQESGVKGKVSSMRQKKNGQPSMRYNPAGRNKRTVWTLSTKPFKGAHFSTFPPDLIEPMVLAGCPEGGVVLDPFAGTGTVLEPCLEHGRRCILIDIDPRLKRWATERKQKKEADMAKAKKNKQKSKANIDKFEQGPVYTGHYKCPACDKVTPWTDWWWPRMYCTCGTKKKMEASRVPLAERGQKVCERCHRPFTPGKFTPYQKYCSRCGGRKRGK